MNRTPVTTFDPRYSSDDAGPVAWPDAVEQLRAAQAYWVTTIRADGRPHITPVVGAWLDDTFYFSSGPEEQKSRNLAVNPRIAVMIGTNKWDEGLDVVLHGDAVVVRDVAELRRLAEAHTTKYGDPWRAEVDADGTFQMPGHGTPVVYALRPTQVLGFGKTGGFSQTRWDFA